MDGSGIVANSAARHQVGITIAGQLRSRLLLAGQDKLQRQHLLPAHRHRQVPRQTMFPAPRHRQVPRQTMSAFASAVPL